VLVTSARLITPSPAFLQLEGNANANITLEGGDLSRAASPVSYKDGATQECLKLRNI
jgi:hypothetical protein